MLPPKTWRGRDLLEIYRKAELEFSELRSYWLGWIAHQKAALTLAQLGQMHWTNRKPNLALRLVRTFGHHDPVWDLGYEGQQAQFQTEYQKLKPLIDLFQ